FYTVICTAAFNDICTDADTDICAATDTDICAVIMTAPSLAAATAATSASTVVVRVVVVVLTGIVSTSTGTASASGAAAAAAATGTTATVLTGRIASALQAHLPVRTVAVVPVAAAAAAAPEAEAVPVDVETIPVSTTTTTQTTTVEAEVAAVAVVRGGAVMITAPDNPGTIPPTRILVGKPGLGMQQIQMPNGHAPAVDPFAFDKFTALAPKPLLLVMRMACLCQMMGATCRVWMAALGAGLIFTDVGDLQEESDTASPTTNKLCHNMSQRRTMQGVSGVRVSVGTTRKLHRRP
ncbi:hypothetical protein QJQ45_022179, partial [Haematococcus lacustris]